MDLDQGYPQVESPEELADRIGLSFSNIALLRRALTHRSYLNENPDALEDNERLEFLGDAVLDFLVGAWLYNHFPEMREGRLTRLRSALVRNDQLAEFSRQLGLGEAMRLGRGEWQTGGGSRKALLGGAFEALVGALYLDSGLAAVSEFIEPLLESATDRIIAQQADQDPKSRLQEWAQAQGFGPPTYRTVSSSGPEHAKIFDVEVLIDDDVLGYGSGNSKRAATKEAAQNALEKLGID